jgi:hypothetical protein
MLGPDLHFWTMEERYNKQVYSVETFIVGLHVSDVQLRIDIYVNKNKH